MDKTRVMEDVSLLTQKHLFITTDKHEVPPTKRLFKVDMLDPSLRIIGPWGTSGDPGQPRLMTCLSIYKLVRSAPDGCFVSCTEGPESVIQFIRPRGMIFAYGPFKNSFQTTIRYLNLPICLLVIRGGETMSDSVFKLDLCKLVIVKMGSAITYDYTRGTKSGEESFKKFTNNSGIIGGERHEYIFLPS
ncbi:hypothetical protein Tco_0617830 [Tanacetum coccineum]